MALDPTLGNTHQTGLGPALARLNTVNFFSFLLFFLYYKEKILLLLNLKKHIINIKEKQ
jgi:hypothetical protein